MGSLNRYHIYSALKEDSRIRLSVNDILAMDSIELAEGVIEYLAYMNQRQRERFGEENAAQKLGIKSAGW